MTVFDQLELWIAMAVAAPAIAGRRVAFHCKAPAIAGINGSVTVRPDGIPDVRIKPDLPADRLLHVYLHELAHVRLHSAKMARSTMHQEPPEHRINQEYIEPDQVEVNNEAEAEELVDEWLRYGYQHTDPDDYLGIIDALYQYYKR